MFSGEIIALKNQNENILKIKNLSSEIAYAKAHMLLLMSVPALAIHF